MSNNGQKTWLFAKKVVPLQPHFVALCPNYALMSNNLNN